MFSVTRPIFLCEKIDADTYAKGLPTIDLRAQSDDFNDIQEGRMTLTFDLDTPKSIQTCLEIRAISG